MRTAIESAKNTQLSPVFPLADNTLKAVPNNQTGVLINIGGKGA
jgi:hypothetical protein